MGYSTYLNLETLLNAQLPKSNEHDEMLFITIHQTYELWFKQILFEGKLLQRLLHDGETYESLATISRMLVILKTMVKQTDILETMTPLSFASFREVLDRASGFQSFQFRMFEFFMGLKNSAHMRMFPENSPESKQLHEYYSAPTLYDSFLRYLRLNEYSIPEEVLKRDYQSVYTGNEQVQEILIDIYRNDPVSSLLCEKFVDLDEGLQEWRYRHIKMVERTIGVKMGTGGSSGSDYLKKTLSSPAFIDLWNIRCRF